jgi:opacity protein-like surface antigen
MKKLMITLAVLTASGLASAQTTSEGWYGGFEAGVAKSNAVKDGAKKIASELGEPDTGIQHDTTSSAYRLYVGKQINKTFAVEGGYFSTGNFTSSATEAIPLSGNDASVTAKLTGSAQGFEIVGKANPFENGFFVKAGLHRSKVKEKFTVSATDDGKTASASISASESGIGYLAGLGYEHDFTKELAGNVSYTRYFKLGGESDIKADLITVGVKYKF